MAVWTQFDVVPSIITAEIFNQLEQNGEYLADAKSVSFLPYSFVVSKSDAPSVLISRCSRMEDQCVALSRYYNSVYDMTAWGKQTISGVAIQNWIDFQNNCYNELQEGI